MSADRKRQKRRSTGTAAERTAGRAAGPGPWLTDHPRRQIALAAALLAALVVALYGRTLTRGWVIAPPDDLRWLALVRGASLRDIPSWFVSQPDYFYRPLARISFYLDHLVWGDHAFGFRLTSLILFIVAAAALGWFVYEATRSRTAALIAAALYEVYPGNWEVAYWVSARADVLAAIFVLSTLALLLRARREWRISYWLGAMGCATCALFSKEVGLALAPLIVVAAIIFTPRLRESGRYWLWAAITLAVFAVVALGYWKLRTIATQMGVEDVSMLRRLHVLWPRGLRKGGMWWYRPLVRDVIIVRYWLGTGVWLASAEFWGRLAVWLGAMVMMLRRAPRPALLFFLFIPLALLPALKEADTVPFRRFYYLPVAGEMALTALACSTLLECCRGRWPKWGWAALGVVAGLLVAFMIGTWDVIGSQGTRLFGR